jgi:hypothetical protein
MHCWNDENCLQILNNCQRALPEKGKMSIYDFVLESMGGLPQIFDTMMITLTNTSMERTEEQWRNLLTTAKFLSHKLYSTIARTMANLSCQIVHTK